MGIEKSTWFTGAEARAEDTAFIEKSDASATFVKRVKEDEATVEYRLDRTLKDIGQYLLGEDVIAFNPDYDDFPTTIEGRVAFRWHEVIHRADNLKYNSSENVGFVTAIDNAIMWVTQVIDTTDGMEVRVLDKVLDETKDFAREDIIFVHDILSALRRGENDGLLFGHSAEYWASSAIYTPLEIFANIGTLDLMNGKGLSVIKKYFIELFNAYAKVIK